MKKNLMSVYCLAIAFVIMGHQGERYVFAGGVQVTPFTAHDGYGATVEENKRRRLPVLRARRAGRVAAKTIPDLKTWPGTPTVYSDLDVMVPSGSQWAFNLHRPKSKDLTDLSPSGYLAFRNIGVRPGPGVTGLKWGSREYNVPDRRFIDCDYTEIPREHGLYVSNAGNTLLERCTFLRVGSQGAQWAHRPLPYQQYHADNAPYQTPPRHVVRDCHFIDCAYGGDRPSFNLTYFSPGTSEHPGTLLVEDSSFVCKWDKPRIDNPHSANPRIRHSSGAMVVTPSSVRVPLDPTKGPMMRNITLCNCLFDFTAGDRAIIELRSVYEIVIEACCFIARDHPQNGINIDRMSGTSSVLDGTKSQRLVLRNNLAENVVIRLGLGDGTRNADIVTIPLHTPDEEVIYSAVTGQQLSRRRL